MTQTTPKGRPLDDELTGRVLNEVRDALDAVGYVNLKIEKVASAVGCGKTTIYRRWPTKAELVAAAILDGVDPGATPDTGDVVEDLVEHAWQHVRNFKPDGQFTPKHNRTLLAMFDAEVIPFIEERYMKHRHVMGREILDRAVASGQVASGLDHDLIIDTLAGLTLFRLSIKPDARVHTDAELKDSYRKLVRSLVASPTDVTSPG